ncbi:MAG: DUF3108 domain-containing protein [Thiotrichales bacterium]|nr:DUF3108 domain-containing protein [Thiotrichales bacterium]MBT4653689.1 DUF3108 domain-containing protein [Thiotrichales bacterium]MBT5499844.1 DUF3108 domain-containing protein [Thiotrichales bacterium]MBT6772095.1 DUF3108 domain-containing protein [Thiotrichales bacterium]MBT7150623.1 DUF3108 domain-containing protein [Thiotrichales bacterium]
MKKIVLLFLSLIFTNSLALSPYIGNYQLYADTKMGNLQIGSAVLTLEMNDSAFTFTTEAKTESLWKALYDYSRSEKSTGNETDGQVINNYFSVIEKIKGEVKRDYEITIVTDKNYALSSTGEEFEIKPGLLVDPLSVYLALSNDMLNKPNQSEFTYQVVNQEGVKYLKFRVIGQENISINGSEINTIRVTCEELELTLNLSVKDNFQPVKIHKINGKTEFTMLLIEFRS